MKLRSSLFFSFLAVSVWAIAQSNPTVKVTYERSSKGDVTFYAETESYTPYTVTLSFPRLTNASYSEGYVHETAIHRGKTRLLSLRPTTADVPIGFSYRYNYRVGNKFLKPDTNFVYLLPLAEGKTVKVKYLSSIESSIDKEKPKRQVGIAFLTVAGDTIFAARGGLVTEIKDHSASTAEGTSFQATENYVMVYHKDGTFARYKLFRNGGIFVSPGDEIIPGQPIGIIGGENYKQGSHLRFSVYCPHLSDFSFQPLFHLSPDVTGKPELRETYVVEHPASIVVQEMNKKDKKKYLPKE